MSRRLIGAVLGIGAVAAATYALRHSTLRSAVRTQLFIIDQLRREYPGLATPNKRRLDFAPFAIELAALADTRAAALEQLADGASIADLQHMQASATLSAEDLTLHYLRRIRTHDIDRLNSVVELNPEALLIARGLDAERRAGAVRGPLHGIPILLKDNIATGDRMRTTAGARALEGAGSDRDSFIAHRLRAAGAVLLGKANMSEWAYYMSSRGVCGYSAIGGQTHSPYGRFEVGGSSSGSAVAVAAGLCAAAIGTETSGSLIYPASQNGIVSLKPSLGLVSRDRIIPITDAQDTAGPMARSVADAALLMAVLAGADPNDPLTDAGRASLAGGFAPGRHGLRGVRVGVVRRVLRPGDARAYARAAAGLREAGADVREIEAPPVIATGDVFAYGFRQGVDAYLDAVRGYAPVASLAEVVAFNRANSRQHAPYGQDLLEKALASTMTDAQYAGQVRANRASGAQGIRASLARHQVDLILTLSNYLSGSYAPAGFPALSVPVGRRASGEPVGATLVGELWADRELLAAGAALEAGLAALGDDR
jgi:amidase